MGAPVIASSFAGPTGSSLAITSGLLLGSNNFPAVTGGQLVALDSSFAGERPRPGHLGAGLGLQLESHILRDFRYGSSVWGTPGTCLWGFGS